MECNKVEAMRAKDIAEKKLLELDFSGAKKVALKAQQLFPDLENISQLLTVCEVHCAAAIKINGLEDWYGILQVQPTADELSIKKQYRKLALSLHPDKNKFTGAEAAFKLIGEAHRTLTDRENRSSYDMRRKTVVKSVPQKPKSQQGRQNHNTVQPEVPSFFQNYSQFSGAQTIWTKCPHCGAANHQTYAFLNRAISCQRCSNPYVVYDTSVRQPPGTAPGYVPSARQPPGNVPGYVPKHPGPGVSQHDWFPPQNAFRAANFSSTGFSAHDPFKTTQEKHFGTHFSSTGTSPQGVSTATQQSQSAANTSATGLNGAASYKENGGERGKNVKTEEQVNSVPTNQHEVKFGEVKFANMNKRESATKAFKKQKTSRKRKIEECSEDEFSDTESSDSDVIIQKTKPCAPNMDGTSNENRRRSTRQKRNVTYVENQSDDDDFVSLPKRYRGKTPPSHSSSDDDGASDAGKNLNTDVDKNEPPKESSSGQQEDHVEEQPEVSVSSSGNASPAKSDTGISYPDPEFHDFDRDRDASLFRCGQIWATFDDVDGMPRFYAKIIEVICSFKVRFTWLETSPGTQAEIDWSDAGLPVACGNFRLGSTETTDNRSMFSHLMAWQKGNKRNTYMVRPRKGEVWAIFKNWEINWSSDEEDHTPFVYEIIEILSDDISSIKIVMLYKVEEFVSVFVREPDADFKNIPSDEILRFSHMIPSYKIPVPEEENFCRVYYELDPASLPSDSEDKLPVISLGVQLEQTLRCIQKKCFKPAAGQVENLTSHYTSDETSTESEWLHSFESEKSYAKLAVGQIWALYCDIDHFPKCYAHVSDVDHTGPKVTVRWMDYCDNLEDVGPWLRNALPIACGKFKFSTSKGSQETFCTLEKFSHLVHFESSKKLQYNIYPHVGEVWALYKNWSVNWKESDMKSCEYDVVEILNAGSVTRAALLTKVKGSDHAIFMQKIERKSVITVDIPESESLRFSHHVPSYRLNKGPWNGHWQLDPRCVPVSLLQ